MALLLRIFTWNRNLWFSVLSLVLLSTLNFYGLYTNKFYFFKVDNYIFPVLSIVHLIYLYALWFKIREEEPADMQMRNLEYALYVILLVYVFKTVDTFAILLSYGEFDDHLIPLTFLPIGILMLLMHLMLIILTFISFKYRLQKVGSYKFDNLNDKIDSW
ncbi:hypothetical protein [Spongiimicrobium sp. 3-5]|uniref:hypothetical protein n=1 Tax=Spongiimicrobium sp. 3-5 TaxID=3332596 RepID=UPI00398151A3